MSFHGAAAGAGEDEKSERVQDFHRQPARLAGVAKDIQPIACYAGGRRGTISDWESRGRGVMLRGTYRAPLGAAAGTRSRLRVLARQAARLARLRRR